MNKSYISGGYTFAKDDIRALVECINKGIAEKNLSLKKPIYPIDPDTLPPELHMAVYYGRQCRTFISDLHTNTFIDEWKRRKDDLLVGDDPEQVYPIFKTVYINTRNRKQIVVETIIDKQNCFLVLDQHGIASTPFRRQIIRDDDVMKIDLSSPAKIPICRTFIFS
jgi:hypothetical protein